VVSTLLLGVARRVRPESAQVRARKSLLALGPIQTKDDAGWVARVVWVVSGGGSHDDPWAGAMGYG
jgi:hypothetical protein